QDSEKQLSVAKIEKGKLSESISSQESELKLAQERADKLTGAAANAEKSVEDLKAQTIDILNKKAKAQNELSAADGRLDYLVTRLEKLYANADNFLAEQEQLKNSLSKLKEEVEAREKEINDLTTRQKQVNSEIGQLQSKAALLDKNIREMEQKRGARASRLQSLQELQEAYEGYDAGVKALLARSKDQKNSDTSMKGICGVIAEIVRTESRYELAVEAGLGSNVQDIVTETMEDARDAVEYLKERKSGRATLLSIDVITDKGANGSEPPSDGILAVASQVVGFDDKYSSIVEYLLGNTLIVEDLNKAVELAGDALPPVRFATLDGQIVTAAGAITGGTGSEGAGLLRRSREIVDLKKEVAVLEKQLADLAKERDGLASEISAQQRERDEISRELQKKQIDYASTQKDMSQCKQRLERLERELSIVESERDALEKEVVTLEESKKRLAADSAELEKQSEEINKKIAALQEELRAKSQQRDAVVLQCTNIKVQLAAKKQQESGLADKLKSLERGRDRLLQTLSSHETSATSDEESEKGIAEKIDTLSKTLEGLFSERSRLEGEVAKMETERQKAQTDLAQSEAAIRDHRRDTDQLNQGKYQLEVTKTQLQMNIDSLVSKMRERYGVSIEELQSQGDDSAEKSEEETDGLDADELESRIEELRDRMGKMGTVNLTAVDEYNRQKERYDLLITQKEDLIKAKDSLYNIIQRINRESRDRLKETFESVNASFKELFIRLFGGGEAELVMIGEGDVLESGIEMAARPPGKKPQTIAMLSSGERSLTAIALLFALFRIKPSPFCVMDEVDAALDDANVGRFTDMVREFSKNTQFIIITHNKRTMEMADVLYGVTMEESGVSKLVSLRMNDGDTASQAAG
ncbi:chromosome segregation protein SMC, partial [Candidatus Poribacteria bacterium]